MSDDDKAQLTDLHSAIEALKKAESDLQFALAHHGPNSRASFVFHVGFARGKIERIASRIYGEAVPDLPIEEESGESDP